MRPTKRGRERERDLKIWPRDHVGLENLTSLVFRGIEAGSAGARFHVVCLFVCLFDTDAYHAIAIGGIVFT